MWAGSWQLAVAARSLMWLVARVHETWAGGGVRVAVWELSYGASGVLLACWIELGGLILRQIARLAITALPTGCTASRHAGIPFKFGDLMRKDPVPAL